MIRENFGSRFIQTQTLYSPETAAQHFVGRETRESVSNQALLNSW